MSRIHRRTLLAGLGGAALALPALEIMGTDARAQSAAIPKRFVVMFGGISTGRQGATNASEDRFTPTVVGPDYELRTATQPLGNHGVTGDVSIVSGLEMPVGDASSLPPGGRLPNFHSMCFGPLFSGVATYDMNPVNGPSADQLVGEAIGADARVQTMAYRVQASAYGDSRAHGMSYRLGPGDALQPITPKTSPQLIWSELFDGFVPPDANPAELAAAEALRSRRASVLDLVSERTSRLRERLSTADRTRLEQHLDHVRDLETRIAGLQSGGGGEGCSLIPDPGADPPIGADYADELARGELIVDMMAMAFACDLSRSASLQITLPQCSMNMQSILGVNKGLHEIGHTTDDGVPGQRLEQLSEGIAWHVDLFARLVAHLKDATEIDGSSVLDHTALVLLFEGGHGFDPQTGDDNRTHSSENMVGLIAGGAGGMTQGQHVASGGRHPVSLVSTAMAAVGVPGGLGEVNETIPEIL